MHIFRLILSLAGVLIFGLSVVLAEPLPVSRSKKRLSQLEFDEHPEDKATQAQELLNQILNPVTEDPKPGTNQPNIKPNSTQGTFNNKPVEVILPVALRYLPLRLKGPILDKFDSGSITSIVPWKLGADKICRDSTSFEAKCSRINGLKQILQKFSGSNDFFESSCSQPCREPKQKSLLYDLRLSQSNGIALQSFEDKTGCHFRFSLESAQKWTTLEVDKVQCICISDCLIE